jgi:ribosome-binding factor A
MPTQRPLRISQSIKRELSELIRRDLEDPRISGIVSITDVECTNDCRSAKVFVSVFGDSEKQESTMAALNDHIGYIRGELCRRLKLRFAPEMNFNLDNSLERGAKVSELIAKISRGEV